MKFSDYYKSDFVPGGEELSAGDFPADIQSQGKTVLRFLQANAGRSFNRGLYKLFAPADYRSWQKLTGAVFPEVAQDLICFGCDWLGRVFALDKTRLQNKAMQVTLLDPSAAEIYETPCSFMSFHNEELINYREEALAEPYFLEWLETGHQAPDFTQCIGYVTPIFMGGEHEFHNLLPGDMKMYWEICADILKQAESELDEEEIL